jgi:ParB family chromosome partitioning protein
MDKGLTVRQAEALLKQVIPNKTAGAKANPNQLSPVYKKLEDKLCDHFSTKVQLQHQKNGSGKITVEYADLNGLNKILEAMQLSIS